MRRLILTKLNRLETVQLCTRRVFDPVAEQLAGDQVCEQIRSYLQEHGFVQGERESLAGTFARAMGVGGRELERLLTTE